MILRPPATQVTCLYALALVHSVALLLSPCIAHADALRDVDRAADDDDDDFDASPIDSDGTSSSSWDDSLTTSADEEFLSPLAELFVRGLAELVMAPWKLPRRFDQPCRQEYARYPFADGTGLLREQGRCATTPTSRSYRVAVDGEFESGYLLEGVDPATVSMRAHLPKRFELSGRVSFLSDVLEQPQDFAIAGAVHVLYRHAQLSHVELRSGIGVRLFSLTDLRAGVDFLYAIDGYFARRGVLRIELHFGNLGEAFAGQVRATIGAMVRRFELYAGYDHSAFIGQDNSARLSGPIAGFRAWF